MAELFKFTEDGDLIPVDDVKALSDEDTVIAVDDVSGKVILILGEGSGGLMRAKAMRAARNLRLRSGRRHELIEVDLAQRGEWLEKIGEALSRGKPIQPAKKEEIRTKELGVSTITTTAAIETPIEETHLEEHLKEPYYRGETTPPKAEPVSTEEVSVSERKEPVNLGEISPDDLDYLATFFGAYLLGLPTSKIKKVLRMTVDPRMRSYILDYIREKAVEFFDSF